MRATCVQTTMELVIDAPPVLPQRTPVSPLTRLVPVVMVVGMAGMLLVYVASGAAATRGPAFLMFPAMMVISVVTTAVYSLRGQGRTRDVHRDRCEYLRYLDGIDAVAAETARLQWLERHAEHPEPDRLWTLAGGDRMWQRGPEHPEFCAVRIGLGEVPLATRLVAADTDAGQETDPVTVAALGELLRRRAMVPGMPITLHLRDIARLAVGGSTGRARALLRAMVCQLAIAHCPRDLRIAAVLDSSGDDEWEWLKWLAHHRYVTADGDVRMLRSSGLDGLPAAEPAVHTVVVVDSATAPPRDPVAGSGVTTILVAARQHTDTVELDLDAEQLRTRPDQLTREQAVTCARRLAPHRAARGPRDSGWASLIGVPDPDGFDPEVHWQAGAVAQRFLTVPVGRDEDGDTVHLDLKEAAQGGMGPHGLCIGATGSGKSEFLRTLVLGLITTHPPELLNLVLVDFKGGATFLDLHRSRHVSALITNLAEEAQLVARMADALAGEMTRRQELLRAGNVANISDYRGRTDLPDLPALLIVVDEFSELLQQHPDFAELFVAIGRLGRSLGIHLLLASQRLDEGRLRGLESHLSYRVCLKTFSPNESRAVLGIADAHSLPNTPGAAFLQTPSGDLVRFQTAFVSAPAPRAATEAVTGDVVPRRFTGSALPAVSRRVDRTAPTGTVLQRMVGRVSGYGTPAHQVWLPPLPRSVPLSDVLLADQAPLTVAVGLLDLPFEQRRDRLLLELGAGQGNVAIVGGPQSGKSTAAKTVVLALAATHHPHDVAVYVCDFGGGALTALHGLPHVGAVAGRGDGDLVRRVVAELRSAVATRETRLTALGFGSMAEYRARRDAGDITDSFPDLFLVIDGWSTFRGEYESLEPAITALATQGLSLGVHVVLTGSRWAEFRPALKDQLGTRIELRLGDPADSEMDRTRARDLGSGPPGRGLTRDGHELLIALPRLDGRSGDRDLGQALTHVAGTLRDTYHGACAPAVRLLPARLAADELRRPPRRRPETEVLIGLGEHELAPVLVDFAAQPDLLILGEAGCGKSTALRMLCRDLVTANAPAGVQVFIVDFRRSLLSVVESDHLAGYAASTEALVAALPAVLDTLRHRLPGPTVTQRQLRERAWWVGPEIYVVIDDYDLVSGSAVNPLAPLVEYLPQARDLGLHLVLARRSGGAARAMFDPLLAAVKELGCMGLMMSASPEDGVLLGSARPVRLPPGRGTLITRAAPEQLVQIAVPESDAR